MSSPPVSTTGTWKVAPAAIERSGGLNMRFMLPGSIDPGDNGESGGTEGNGGGSVLVAACPLASTAALNCASAAGVAAIALRPGTTPTVACASGVGRAGGAGAGAELESSGSVASA